MIFVVYYGLPMRMTSLSLPYRLFPTTYCPLENSKTTISPNIITVGNDNERRTCSNSTDTRNVFILC